MSEIRGETKFLSRLVLATASTWLRHCLPLPPVPVQLENRSHTPVSKCYVSNQNQIKHVLKFRAFRGTG